MQDNINSAADYTVCRGVFMFDESSCVYSTKRSRNEFPSVAFIRIREFQKKYLDFADDRNHFMC